MSRLFIGHKPGVGGVVKVMRNDSDNPLTTPNNDHGKYLFNSETMKIGYIEGFEEIEWVSGLGSGTQNYWPGGSNINTCDKYVRMFTTTQDIYLFGNRIIGRSWPTVTEHRELRSLGQEVEGPRVIYQQTDENQSFYVGYNIARLTYHMTLVKDFPWLGTSLSQPEGTFVGSFSSGSTARLISMFDLPAGNNSIPVPSPGASGTRNALINPTLVRIGKGGVNGNTTNRDSLIIDSTRVPAKIARAGQVNIPAGSSVDVMSPVPLTQRAYMDYIVWRQGQEATFPQLAPGTNAGSQEYSVTCAVFSDRVRIFNRGQHNATVHYIIFFDDGISRGGGSQVLRQIAGGHTQMKRPGSSDSNPGSRDVLLDTRLAYLPIIAEGRLTRAAFNESAPGPNYGDRARTVTWSNPGGFLPFVKFYVERESGAITEPWSVSLRSNGGQWQGWQANDGTPATLTNTSVRFHMAINHPYRLRLTSGGQVGTDDFPGQRPVAIRYYVFAIPTNF